MKLVLFDIDGTLISSGGAGTRSLDLAFQQIFGISRAFSDISMAGKTDFQIIREGLHRHAIHTGNGIIPLVARCYIDNLGREIANSPSRHLKPGVEALLGGLREREDIFTVGLLTGNIRQGAQIKLDAFGIYGCFSFGAFGDDSEDRDSLLPFALERYVSFRGTSIEPRDCVVIGDTPLDVRCARRHGACSVAVATGPYTMEALAKAAADVVLPDLSDTAALIRYLS